MKKFLVSMFCVVSCLVLLIPTAAATSLLRSDHPDRYEVQKGDTLWDISGQFLTDAWRWPEIWDVNPDIENPHLIYPGDIVYLRYVDGKPTLQINPGDAGRTVKLTPPTKHVKLSPKIRESRLTSSIPGIPLDAIANFLNQGRILDKDTLADAPYVLAGKVDKLVFGAGEIVYARGQWPAEAPNAFGVFRPGTTFIDPETGDILGYEAIEVGSARVLKQADDLYTLVLSSVQQEIRMGDRLLPTEQQPLASMFNPKSPNENIAGVIMTVFGGLTQVGKNSVVAINRGAESDLAVGDILAILKAGKMKRDRIGGGRVQLPNERAGLLMIFRSFEKMSYGLVLETSEPLKVGDLVRNP